MRIRPRQVHRFQPLSHRRIPPLRHGNIRPTIYTQAVDQSLEEPAPPCRGSCRRLRGSLPSPHPTLRNPAPHLPLSDDHALIHARRQRRPIVLERLRHRAHPLHNPPVILLRLTRHQVKDLPSVLQRRREDVQRAQMLTLSLQLSLKVKALKHHVPSNPVTLRLHIQQAQRGLSLPPNRRPLRMTIGRVVSQLRLPPRNPQRVRHIRMSRRQSLDIPVRNLRDGVQFSIHRGSRFQRLPPWGSCHVPFAPPVGELSRSD